MLDAAKAFLASEYARVRLLKSSARGEVWLVSDKAGRPCVLRALHAGGLPFALLKAHQGAAAPLWPEIYFYAEDEDETIVVEEYVGGRSLEERRVARQWLTEAEARALLLSLADGLSKLHALGVVHRDIKPAHIFVQFGNADTPASASRTTPSDGGPRTATVRLIDFDAARVVTAGAAHDTHLLGTEGYAPPEQFGFGATDGRSDIYALGVTVREMMGPSFDAASPLGKILLRCTEKDPDRRYPSAQALAAALRPSRRKTLLRNAAKALLVALLTLALGVGTLVLLARNGAAPAEQLEQTLEEAATDASDALAGKKTTPPDENADSTSKQAGDAATGASGGNSRDATHAAGVNHADQAQSSGSSARSGRLESTLTFNGTLWDDAETIVLSSDDWRTWARTANGAVNGDYALFFPSGWNVALTLTNDGDAPAVGTLAVAFDGGSHTESDAVPVTLAPGASQTIPIALGGRRIDSADAKTASLGLHFTGDGLAGIHDWVLTFYLQNDHGYHVSDELRAE